MEPLEASARNLSHLVGQGVFAAWSDPAFYQTARRAPHGSVAWGEGDRIELCADALYLQLTGKSVEDAIPAREAPRADPTPARTEAGRSER